jgi:hypothetical protein
VGLPLKADRRVCMRGCNLCYYIRPILQAASLGELCQASCILPWYCLFSYVRLHCIHSNPWQANLFEHVSGDRKYSVSEIGRVERWRSIFSAGLWGCGVGAGDNKSVFFHDGAVGRPTGGGWGRTREGGAKPMEQS